MFRMMGVRLLGFRQSTSIVAVISTSGAFFIDRLAPFAYINAWELHVESSVETLGGGDVRVVACSAKVRALLIRSADALAVGIGAQTHDGPLADVIGALVSDICMELPVPFDELSEFTARLRRSLVLVVTSVSHLCVLSVLHGLNNLSELIDVVQIALCIADRIVVRHLRDGKPVRQSDVRVRLQERAQRWVGAVHVLLVPRAVEGAQLVAATARVQVVLVHGSFAQH